MKVAIVVLCLVAAAYAEKRLFLDTMHLFDGAELKKIADAVVAKFGSDATEKECERECTVLFTNDILDHGCDVACLSVQDLIHKFATKHQRQLNLDPLHLFDHAELKKIADAVVAKFGSDATEKECERECTVLFTNDILDHGCDVACLSVQDLIHKFATKQQRQLNLDPLHLFDHAELKKIADAVVAKFGSDATEKECERECQVLFTSNILDKGCDVACLSVQDLIHKFATKQQRQLNLDPLHLFDHAELKKIADAVVAKFGSDATEKECERECTVLFTNDILDHGCDVACLSVQDLIHKFATKQQRQLNLDPLHLFDHAELKKIADAVVAKFGSDATEKECERECQVLFTNNILDKGCDVACLSVQDLIHKFATKQQRQLDLDPLHLFDHAELKKIADAVVAKFGSDATEKECERECTVLFTNDILDHGCDVACLSVQDLIHKFATHH